MQEDVGVGSARVAFATCRAWPESTPDDRLAIEELARGSIEAVPVVWDDPNASWEEFDLVVLRSTWDYFERRDEFLEWVDQVHRRTPVWNPPSLVRWNSHKRYLLDLEARGVPIVPTELLARGSSCRLDELRANRRWQDVVLKPAVGANAYRLVRATASEPAEGQAALDGLVALGDVLVQPFMTGTETAGERSLVFIDGRYSHATAYPSVLRENPRKARPIDPGPEALAGAESVLRGLDPTPLYARLDYLAGAEEEWRLGELEIIEPELFLASDVDAPRRFAAACRARISTR